MSKDAIKMQCPQCDRKLKVPASKLEKSIVCPGCSYKFKLDGARTADEDDLSTKSSPVIGDKFSAGLFEEDIDDLLAGAIPPVPVKKKKGKQRKQLNYGTRRTSPLEKENQTGKTSSAAQTSEAGETSDVQAAWQEEKKVTSARDESFYRNGIGLLIMAIGLAMLPFFAGRVESLSPVMPYIPLIAIAIAFVACFMIAISMRRSNIGAVLISGVPFLLICLLGLGGWYYTNSLKPEQPVADADAETTSEEESKPVNDNFTIDRDRLDENAASQFVPPLKPKPKPVVTERDEQPPVPDSVPAEQPIDSVPESNLKPSEFTARQDRATRQKRTGTREPSELEQQLKQAVRHANNQDKLQLLLQREQTELRKGLVSNDIIRSPREFADNHRLSNLAGEQTVYGIAYYSTRAITGLDAAHHADDVDELFDVLIPITGRPQFEDSIAPADSTSSFIGLNVITSPGGISGLQGVFRTADNRELPGKWVGDTPQADSDVVELRVDNDRVFGIVVYRNQLRAVGLRLIE